MRSMSPPDLGAMLAPILAPVRTRHERRGEAAGANRRVRCDPRSQAACTARSVERGAEHDWAEHATREPGERIEPHRRTARTTAQCHGAPHASKMPLEPEALITIRIQRRRPMRSATSLPRIEAGTA